MQSDCIEPLAKYTKLYELSLANNKIADFGWTRFLKRNRISVIWAKGNPISSEIDYREKIYKALGIDLDVLDGVDRSGHLLS